MRRLNAIQRLVIAKLAEPRPEVKSPVPTPLKRSTHKPQHLVAPESKRRSAKCLCGSLKCGYCYRRIFSALRRKGLVGLGNKWTMMSALNEDERAMVRMKNNRNWPGPDPSPRTSSMLLIEASLFVGGVPRCGRVRCVDSTAGYY